MRMSEILQTHEQLIALQDAIIKSELCPKRDNISGKFPAYMTVDKERELTILGSMPDHKQDLVVPFAI